MNFDETLDELPHKWSSFDQLLNERGDVAHQAVTVPTFYCKELGCLAWACCYFEQGRLVLRTLQHDV